MDPTVAMIVSALATGAAAALKDTATEAVKDAYNGLKVLIQRKFQDNPKAIDTLADYEKDPDTYEKPMAKKIEEVQAAQDPEVVAAADRLLKLVQPQQAGMGKYNVQISGNVEGMVSGDNAHVNMTFGETKKK